MYVLAAIKPGKAQAALFNLLAAKPQICGVCLLTNLAELEGAIARCQPEIVLCGPGFEPPVLHALLERISRSRPEMRCLAFVDDPAEAAALARPGVRAIAWAATPVQQLSALIDELLR